MHSFLFLPLFVYSHDLPPTFPQNPPDNFSQDLPDNFPSHHPKEIAQNDIPDYNGPELLEDDERRRRLSVNKFDKRDGNSNWYIVSSYNESDYSGVVYAVPLSDFRIKHEFITNLTFPVGMCFNSKDDYFYVIDRRGDLSKILQYRITWDFINTFEARGDPVVITDQGSPQSCEVDAHGNLWYVDLEYGVQTVNYIDLLSENLNENISVFNGASGFVYSPFIIDMYNNDYYFFLNTYHPSVDRQLIKAYTFTNLTNIGTHETFDFGFGDIVDFVLGESYGFLLRGSGELWTFKVSDPTKYQLKTPGNKGLTGLCYGDEGILMADYEANKLYTMIENPTQVPPQFFIDFNKPYKLLCINSAVAAAVCLAYLLA
jgi:hypothetical protein